MIGAQENHCWEGEIMDESGEIRRIYDRVEGNSDQRRADGRGSVSAGPRARQSAMAARLHTGGILEDVDVPMFELASSGGQQQRWMR